MLVFRDHGERLNRQKTRLMWLVENIGNDAFAQLVSERMGGAEFGRHVDAGYSDVWKRRDVLGVHPQKQDGLSWVRSARLQFRVEQDNWYRGREVATATVGDESWCAGRRMRAGGAAAAPGLPRPRRRR